MRIYGIPGSSSDRLLRRRLRAHRLVGLAAAGAVVLAVAVGRPATAVVVVLVGILARRHLRGRAAAADLGSQTEIIVAHRLRRFRPDVLLFDVDLRDRRADVDAVVLGPVAATIEVKTARGRAQYLDDGRVRVGGRWLPGRPLAQAASHAAAVGRWSPVHVEAILCLSGMWGRPRLVEYGATEVWVTSARHLRRVLRRLPRVLDRPTARRLADRLRDGRRKNASPDARRSVH